MVSQANHSSESNERLRKRSEEYILVEYSCQEKNGELQACEAYSLFLGLFRSKKVIEEKSDSERRVIQREKSPE